MIINHNMNALNAHRMMTGNTVSSGKSMEKLSSGLRINRAGDDAAGLAISEKMRGQIRGLDQASRNSQDGISLIQTAEGALNETQSILQRMRELAVQAGNDTNTGEDREQIQNEINQLTSEINRIGNTTEFNTQKVLDGGEANAAGVEKAKLATPTMTNGNAKAAATVEAGAVMTSANLSSNISGLSFKVKVDGGSQQTITFSAGDNTVEKVAAKINATVSGLASVVSGKLVLTGAKTGASGSINISAGTNDALGALHLTVAETKGKAAQASKTEFTAVVPSDDQKYSIGGTELEVKGTTAEEVATSLKEAIEENDTLKDKYEVTVDGAKVTITEKAGQETANAPTVELNSPENDNKAFTATLQIGANQGQAFKLTINDMRSEALGISKANTETGPATKIEANTTEGNAVAKATVEAGAVMTSANLSSNISGLSFKVKVDGGSQQTITFSAGDNTVEKVAAKINATVSGLASVVDGKLVLTGAKTGASGSINISAGTADALGALHLTVAETKGKAAKAATSEFTAAVPKDGEVYKLDEVSLKVEGSTASQVAASLKKAIENDDTLKQKYEVEVTGDKVKITQKAGQESSTVPKIKVEAVEGNGAVFTKAAGVTDGTKDDTVESALDVSSHDNATNAIKVLNDAINKVSTERSKLGAYQNRLEHTINNLGTASENLTAAESRIRDVDMAKEMLAFSKNNILQQASQAMLAQAKQAPQGVLQLLR